MSTATELARRSTHDPHRVCALKAWRNDITHQSAWKEAPSFYHEFWVQDCEVVEECVWVDGVHHERDQRERFQMTHDEVVVARALGRV